MLQLVKAVSYFECINPSIEREVITWKKGMPIEINKIYKHLDCLNYPIAVLSDFENLSKVRMESIFESINLIPHSSFYITITNVVLVGNI